jgi:hypothetical protein
MTNPSANSSSSTSVTNLSLDPSLSYILPNSTPFFGIKLDGLNYLAWVFQFMPILRGHDLLGIIDGTEPCPPKTLVNSETNEESLNPAYVLWQKRDQHLLSWIICSLTPSLVSSMYGLNTSHTAWATLASRYADQSRSQISHLKRQLQSLQQGSKNCIEYLNMAKQWANQLAAVGKPVDDDDLISFIISGLNPAFISFITAFNFAVQDKEMKFADFQSELLSHEILLENQQHHTLTPETGSFAFYTNKSNNQPHLSNRRPTFPPRSNI